MTKYISKSEEETKNIAINFASKLNKHEVVVLSGELGTGKTVFMKGIGKYFGIENMISSPTFTVVNEYISEKIGNIYHFDVYRLPDTENFIESVGTEYFDSGLCIIEWGEKIKEILPDSTIFINIEKDDLDTTNINKRIITIKGGDF